MTQPPPKRRYWQIHLSTAVVMMLLMGLFLFVNLRSTVVRDSEIEAERHWLYGWPFIGVTVTARTWPSDELNRKVRNDPEIQTIEKFGALFHGTTSESPDGKETTLLLAPFLRWPQIAGDVVIALAVISGASVGLEYLIRRRSKP